MATTIVHKRVLCIDLSELPETKYGITLHRGVIVCWDEDRDTRILDLIDSMCPTHRSWLFAAHEHEGCFTLLWQDMYVPDSYAAGESVSVCHDEWVIEASRLLDTNPAA